LVRDELRDNDGLRLERAFLRFAAQPTKHFGVKVLADFAELTRGNPKRALKLAYAEMAPLSRLSVTVGYFKIPFSLLELLPIADFELADVGLTDSLIKDLGFAGRDIGVMADFAPLRKKRWLHVLVGAFRGDRFGAQHYNGPGILAARITGHPLKWLRLGADMSYRPWPVDDTDQQVRFQKFEAGKAFSADITVKVSNLEVRAEWMTGDRTDNDFREPVAELHRGDARSFMAGWLIAAYTIPIQQYRLMPALRVEWLDADLEHSIGSRRLISAGVNFDFSDNVRALVDLTRRTVDDGSLMLDKTLFDADATRMTVQLQVKL
jgi:hypothetical protein